MPITAYDASVAQFVRALTSLKAILIKAEQQVAERGISVSELLEARLAPPAPDMLSFASQVHWAAEGAKRTIERLVGTALASSNDDAQTFAELHERIDSAIAQLQSVSPSDLEAGLSRTIEIENRHGTLRLTGDRFLREFSIPHFFFHVTCAYAILRHRGFALRMGDFLGRFD
ncbi:MAG TPA: DUF1993 domain-containing protein [Polyangiales bacterium]|jgi:hypothetical protein|nr:DUF1993 domain-containing protein [Polyangiales bacterium]